MNWNLRACCHCFTVLLIASLGVAVAETPVSTLPEMDQSIVSSTTLSELAEQASSESLGGMAVSNEPGNSHSIAEPGSIGLMALAGLMGGAIAMRRKLG